MEFIQYYRECRPVKLIDKRCSRLMKVISAILAVAAKVGLASIKDFMGSYVTTVGQSIYAAPAWGNNTRTSTTVVHELAHVEQWSLRYALFYIFSRKKRMHYESVCVQAEMICFPEKFTGELALFKRARAFGPYGIPYEMAFQALKERLKEARLGRIRAGAREVYGLFEEWKTRYPERYK